MPLHPEAKNFLDQRNAAGARSFHELSVEEARQQQVAMAQLLGAAEDVAHVEDRNIPGPSGEIPVRIYTPEGDRPSPIVVYFHGGGWVVGNLETSDLACRALANAARSLVVSVNYRHAPEHKYPAAADDAYAATQWVAAHAESFGGDPSRLAVMGASAGGNLAAVVALMGRDRGGPRIAAQVLQVPVTDYSFDTVSYSENADGFGLTRDSMVWFWKHYLAAEEQGQHPYASPLRAEDLRGLAPALVLTAEFDPLRDEGAAYAVRLQDAGVLVVHKHYAGMVHAFLGAQALDDVAAFLKLEWAR